MKNFDPATNIQRLDGRDACRGVNPAISDSATFTFPKAHLMTDLTLTMRHPTQNSGRSAA